ncbi:hypothetical protein B484DRAFT_398606 [Ochromonadaceae sp. CCMP2298]|nr:hypothetical protein B484DRAFT_398606 [Ochromonadaceae sp. CCMP2298]
MGKQAALEPRAARSTRGIPAPKLGSDSENDDQTARQPKTRKSRKNKAADVTRKSRLVPCKVPLYFEDFYVGKTVADWDALPPAGQRVLHKKLKDFLADKGQLKRPKNWVSEDVGCSVEFSWRAKTDVQQVAIILTLKQQTKKRKKTLRSKAAAAHQATQALAAVQGAAAAAAAAAAGEGEAMDGGGGEGGEADEDAGAGVGELGEGQAVPTASISKAGGPVTQLMLVEVEDQADPNTGGGKIAAHKLTLSIMVVNAGLPQPGQSYGRA